MKFSYFIHLVSKISEKNLGGIEVQYKLAPKNRQPYSASFIKKNNPKKAAVLALFYPDEHNETKILLIKRAKYNGPHSAQISFPGGKFEENDISLKNTALRETEEEVGVKINDVTVLKEMTNIFIPASNFLVTPFLAYSNQPLFFKINHEVEDIIEVSLSNLLNSNSISLTSITTSNTKKISVPCFKLNNYNVWGATAMMLNEIKELLKKI
jgi:8-oxo-dGTP pyrophosphatase MutT (NUDIX family)